MLYAGKNITQSNDQLLKVTIDYLYNAIRNPKPELVAQIRQLRIVHDVDAKRYAACKRMLPYFVCASFNPSVRRTEHFQFTEYFIVDIDHIADKGLVVDDLRRTLEADSRVLMLFLSPSEDGLKLLFRLKEKCFDARLYSIFYKRFVDDFAQQYGLEQVVDVRTSDVCRACFVSIDSNAYINRNAEAVDFSSYVDIDNSAAMTQTLHEIKIEEKTNTASLQVESEVDPDAEAIVRIKEILNLSKTKEEQKSTVYVPQQLNDIIDDVVRYIEDTGLCVKDVVSIQYGKKLRVKLNAREAEVNLFYGKRGYSVVQSPRCGTNSELNAMVADLVSNFLMQ